MDTRFENTQILIWDFDKTFYSPKEKLDQEIREAEYRVIMDHTQWSREDTEAQFLKFYGKDFLSATAVVAKLSAISIAQAAEEMENYFDRTQYLVRDEKLISLFQKLNRYEHYILMNGYKPHVEAALEILGVPKNTFREIVTSDTVGFNKPHEAGFQHVLHKTRLHPDEHLMIGDRIQIDLIPAKNLGMKTCWVYWNTPIHEVNDQVADICVHSVYDLEVVLV